MGVMCGILGHAARDTGLWNDGYFFSRCKRCQCDLIRTDGGWSPLPFGYRVTWRSGLHRHAVASDFKRNLPLMPEEPRRWRLALHRIGRGVLFLPGPARVEQDNRERAPEREASGGLPQMVLLGMLTALGLVGTLTARRR
ncbi:MAG TPA: hypothetical protein VGB54_14540 [Allosphingosinicella sp.]|jgi:hypothetical protein